MACRRIRNRHPSSGEVGLWISKPGFDCLTDDRTDRTKFFVSTSFINRKPFRIIAAGIKATNTPIALPSSLANLGGDPILSYRPMSDSTTERRNGYFGTENDGAGNAYGYSEFYSRLSDGNPASFAILNTASPTSQAFLMRYMVALY